MEKAKVLIIGDLHISDRYTGKHVDYFENCMYCLSMVTKSIKEEGITHLMLLGDLIGIGLAEKNLRTREALLEFMNVLQEWNKLTDNRVYSLRGNHDIGSKLTDYEMFVSLGLLKQVNELDIMSAKFHFFNYGEETRKVSIDEDKYNIGLFHTNLLIEGLTTWYRGGVGVELSTLDNLYGLSMAVAGHIHNPSIKMVSTSIRDRDISLFYPGNLTRPKFDPNLWDIAYGAIFEIDPLNVVANTLQYKLKPINEVFVSTYDDIKEVEDDTETEPSIDLDALSAILEELQYYNISGGKDYNSQIMRVAGLDKVAAELALSYIERVESSFKEKGK